MNDDISNSECASQYINLIYISNMKSFAYIYTRQDDIKIIT